MRLSPVVQSLTEPLLSPLVSAITGVFGGGYSPTSLFADGSKGVVYDNNDFVDSATWRRNLLTYSEQFDNAVWGKQGLSGSVTANAIAAPDGTITADLIPSASLAATYINQQYTTVSGQEYTFSVYMRGVSGGETVKLLAGGGFGNINGPTITLTTTWTRYSLTVTANASSTGFLYILSGTAYGASGQSYYAWGAQLERASSATTYQRITDFNSDFLAAFPRTTLYEDAAGTIPTRVNGLVGLQLDKSLANITARRNLYTYTEQLQNAAWYAASAGTFTVATNSSTDPLGGSTADVLTTSASGLVYVAQNVTCNVDTYTATFRVKLISGSGQAYGIIAGTSGSSITLTSDWQTVTVTAAIGSAGVKQTGLVLPNSAQVAVWGAQLEVGSSATEYQQVVANEGGWMLGNHRYQTTTGSKPVLRGTPIGANTVSNPNFDSATGWTTGTNWSIGSGVATSTGANQFQALTRGDWSGVAGNWYKLTIDISAYTSGSLLVRAGSGTNKGTISKGGVTELYFQADGAGLSLLSNATGFEFIGSITSIDVRDVSAGQVTAPYGLQYDGVDDFLQTAAVDFATATSDGLARRNLLTFPSAFDNAAWVKGNATVTANVAVAPDGSATADKLVVDAGYDFSNSGVATGGLRQNITIGPAATYIYSIYAKKAESNLISFRENTVTGNIPVVNLDTGEVSGLNTSAFLASTENVGNGWWRIQIKRTQGASETTVNITVRGGGNTGTANGTDGVFVWGAQLEVGSTASAFQDIGTDKMFVCAGVRKLSDAARATLVELGSTGLINTFALEAPRLTATAYYRFATAGSVYVSVDTADSAFASPVTSVVSGVGNISGDSCILRVNGTQVASSSGDQGTGSYSNLALYFGRRGGTTLPYNGLDFGLVICGKTLTSTQIANTERWMSYRTGVTL